MNVAPLSRSILGFKVPHAFPLAEGFQRLNLIKNIFKYFEPAKIIRELLPKRTPHSPH